MDATEDYITRKIQRLEKQKAHIEYNIRNLYQISKKLGYKPTKKKPQQYTLFDLLEKQTAV